jgi:hypothetical protein
VKKIGPSSPVFDKIADATWQYGIAGPLPLCKEFKAFYSWGNKEKKNLMR